VAGAIEILKEQLVAKGHGILRRFFVRRDRRDGSEQTLNHEIYDTGDGAAILLYDPDRSRVVLVRQFRLIAFLREGRPTMIEVCAGRLDGENAEARIIKEAEEETGYRIRHPRRLFEAYMSPGVFAEKLTFFAARYSPADRAGDGGGLHQEGEDIEVLEPTLGEALAMIERGEIIDAKTILLLNYADQAGLMRISADQPSGETPPSPAHEAADPLTRPERPVFFD